MALGIIELGLILGVFIFASLALLFVAFKLSKDILKFIMTMIVNSAIGLVAMLILALVGIKIPLTIPVILAIAFFGLGGLGTILILLLFGGLA